MISFSSLRTLFHRARVDPVLPAGLRLYAVGDIHGALPTLLDLHEKIRADLCAHPVPQVRIIYLGDYVDRGEGSRQVLDTLIHDPLGESIHLMGNHEEAMLAFLDQEEGGEVWLELGGLATLLSYGVRLPYATGKQRLQHARAELSRLLPEAHLRFLRGLALSHQEGGYCFVHAGAAQRRDGVVVHGHTVTHAPVAEGARIGIDTGAYLTGRLTALVLEGRERRFLCSGMDTHEGGEPLAPPPSASTRQLSR